MGNLEKGFPEARVPHTSATLDETGLLWRGKILLCGAPIKQRKDHKDPIKRLCHQSALENGKCRFHPHMAQVGAKNGRFIHGLYSKWLPKDVLEGYERATSDHELLSLREEIKLTRGRENQLVKRLSDPDAGGDQLWKKVFTATRRASRAASAGDEDALGLALEDLIEIVDSGEKEATLWDDIHSNTRQLAGLVDGEYKRMIALRTMYSAEVIVVLVARLIKIIDDNVSDPLAQARINKAVRAELERSSEVIDVGS